MSLQGKAAIVAGGNSGIGLVIVLELARQRAGIVVDYVAHFEALEKQVVALGDRVIGVKADVSWIAELQKLFTTVVDAFGRVDIMVTMPASRRARPFSTRLRSNMKRCSRSITS